MWRIQDEYEEDLFTPELPHPYRDPPKAVEGQLLRYWSKEEHQQHHHEDDHSKEQDNQGTRWA
jgi:hypothetical protein